MSSSPSHAGSYQSPLGFTVGIPSRWRVINGLALKENPGLLGLRLFRGMDKDSLEGLRRNVESGKLEIYYTDESTPDFIDNINVFKRKGRLPQTAATTCQTLSAELSATAGRPLKVYECGPQKKAGFDAFYADFDGIPIGTRSLQYQIQSRPEEIIVLTATLKNRTLNQSRADFEAIVASLKQ